MLLDFLFIVRVGAPECWGLTCHHRRGNTDIFDSDTREPRLHLTPASHLPVHKRTCSDTVWSSVYTCRSLAATRGDGEE